MDTVQGLISFLNCAHSGFHAVKLCADMLKDAGFTLLQEADAWRVAPGGKYFVTRNLSSLIAFRVPEAGLSPLRIAAAHCDSPVFKIKENAELSVQGKYTLLNTERYGGMIFSSWFDRPLSVAGRALVRTETGVETRLVDAERDLLVIPNVAIHMNRNVNDGYKYNAQTDLMPLFGSANAKDGFRALIAELAGVREEDLLGSDLFVYNRVPASVWGMSGEYISAGRLDDLECVYAALTAMTDDMDAPDTMPVCCVFDNEEVGSMTKQGAASTFLADTLRRACVALGASEEDYLKNIASSMMLSSDNAHAVHPNHPEFSDANNRVFMNEGVVIKSNANQKYTTDGVSQALLRAVFDRAEVPYQFFANRSDIPGGSTLGNIANSHVSLNTVDIGLAQLAMHSCWETAGTRDAETLIRGMRAFYAARFTALRDGAFSF